MLTGEHALQLKIIHPGFQSLKGIAYLFCRLFVFLFQGHFKQQRSLFPGRITGFPGFYYFLQPAPVLLDFPGRSSIIPKARGNDLFFKLREFIFLAVYLKDAPSGQVCGFLSPGVSVSVQLTYGKSLQ
jgi:hypothetical protein